MHDIGFLCGSVCVCVVVSKSKNSLLDVSVIRHGREEAEKQDNRFVASVSFTRMFFVAV